jgi:ligand-binding sensor domain-containing protein
LEGLILRFITFIKFNRSKVTAIVPDKYDQKVWIGTVYAGLSYYDLLKKKWFVVSDPIVKNIDVSSIAITQDVIAIGADQGLFFWIKKAISGINLIIYPKIMDYMMLLLKINH